jgi:hypothetical protein
MKMTVSKMRAIVVPDLDWRFRLEERDSSRASNSSTGCAKTEARISAFQMRVSGPHQLNARSPSEAPTRSKVSATLDTAEIGN